MLYNMLHYSITGEASQERYLWLKKRPGGGSRLVPAGSRRLRPRRGAWSSVGLISMSATTTTTVGLGRVQQMGNETWCYLTCYITCYITTYIAYAYITCYITRYIAWAGYITRQYNMLINIDASDQNLTRTWLASDQNLTRTWPEVLLVI